MPIVIQILLRDHTGLIDHLAGSWRWEGMQSFCMVERPAKQHTVVKWFSATLDTLFHHSHIDHIKQYLTLDPPA